MSGVLHKNIVRDIEAEIVRNPKQVSQVQQLMMIGTYRYFTSNVQLNCYKCN